MTIAAQPFARVALTQRLQLAAIGPAGHVIAVEPVRGGFALIDPQGSVTRREVGTGRVLAADIAADGRVALLETFPQADRWPTRIRILAPTGNEHAFDAAVVDGLFFDSGTGGALVWAGDDALWLAGAIGETNLWVGAIDPSSASIRAAGQLEDPYAESEVRLRAASDPSTCFVVVNAGQHGGWVFAAKRTGARLDAHQLVPSDVVGDICVLEDGTIVVLEDSDLVRCAADGRELRRSPLEGQIGGYPVSVAVTPHGLLVESWPDGPDLALVDASSLRVDDRIVLPAVSRDQYLGSTLARDGRFATVIHRGARPGHERTTLLLWSLDPPATLATR